jgi:proliferating cell nuclear antigen
MVFTPKGVRIMEMDRFHTLMVDLFLDKDKLEDYHCPKNVQIGISIPNLYKLLKPMNSTNNVLTMYMTKDNLSTLEMVIESNDSDQTTELQLDLMDLEVEEDMGFPEDNYDLVLNMSSSDFKQICASTKSIDTKQIKITYSKGIYTFSSKGNIGKQKITRPAQRVSQDGGEATDQDQDDEGDFPDTLYEGIFDLDKLSNFTKCASIAKTLKIYLGNDLPLICEYELSCGVLNLLLGNMDDI